MNCRKDLKGRNLKPNEEQMKDGRYRYRYIDVNGNRHVIYSWKLVVTDKVPPGKKNDLSLREKEAEIAKFIEDKVDIFEAESLTVANLIKLYLTTKKLANSTRENYEHMLVKNIEPNRLGQIKISKVKKTDIKLFYSYLYNERNFSASSIQLYQNLLYPAFDLAIEDNLLRKNPCHNCMKDYKFNSKESSRISLTREEQRILLDYVKNHNVYSKYYVMIAFMLGSGCRISEVMGLTWNDIDFENNIITINHQILYRKKNGKTAHYAELPKNRQSRIIPLQKELKAIMSKYKRDTFFLSQASSCVCDEYSNFVFLNSELNLYTPNTITRAFHEITAAYNYDMEDESDIKLPVFTAHVLRHTFCTRMAENGLDVKVLQKIMGHKTLAVTMNIYNHVTEQRIQDSVQYIDSALAI